MSRSFEQLLAVHCGPTFAGIKPACLFSCEKRHCPVYPASIWEYGRLFQSRKIHFEILGERAERFLLLVYHRDKLSAQLAGAGQQAILRRQGYPATADLPAALAHLKKRVAGQEDFPHEIGIFLGYPPADVAGFQENRGKNYLLCGYWKVYANAGEAKSMFERYDRCRETIARRLSAGLSIAQLFRAV
ncbi:MAG: DUF3793 family protein [Peptococcaceae bacterium]|nr:DUF3793 family protein [Peptococcaceae bacterium]